MKDKTIARLIAEKVYNPCRDDTDFAIQLFIERTVIPHGIDSYTADDVKKWILEKFESLKK